MESSDSTDAPDLNDALNDALQKLGIRLVFDTKQYGPIARAYDKIIQLDRTPHDSLTCFGLTREDFKEIRPVVDYVTFNWGADDVPKLMLAQFSNGMFVGLQIARERLEGP